MSMGMLGVSFLSILEKIKKSIFHKNIILDITHHLRGATELSWGQWKSAYSTLYFYWVKPWKTQNLKIWTPLCWPLNLYKRVLGPSKNHETHIDLWTWSWSFDPCRREVCISSRMVVHARTRVVVGCWLLVVGCWLLVRYKGMFTGIELKLILEDFGSQNGVE